MNGRATSRAIPLRGARGAFTRQRLRDAARDVFFARGYGEATMDEIAQAAGKRRSTLYTHFRDKGEILAVIAEDYAQSLGEIMRHIPGPCPSHDEIESWMMEVATFVAGARIPTVLLMNLGNVSDVPIAVQRLGEELMQALASRLPAFRQALEPGPTQALSLARAAVVLRELAYAALQYARHDGTGIGRDLLIVAGELFEQFVRSSPDPAK